MKPLRSGKEKARAARKRKAAMLTALLGFLGVIWAKNLIPDAPREISAGTPPPEAATSATEHAAPLPPLALRRPSALDRNPFAIDVDAYERRPTTIEVEPSIESPIDPAPRGIDADELAALTLQGTLLGEIHRATINGRTLEVGDSINGFVIKAIGLRHVVIERDGIEATIGMWTP